MDFTPAPHRARARPAAVGAALAATLVVALLLVGCSPRPASAPHGAHPTPDRIAGASSSPPGTAPPRAATPAFDAGRFSYRTGAVSWGQQARVAAANRTPPAPVPGYGWALLPLVVRNTSDDAATPGQFTVTLHAGGWAVSHRSAAAGLTRLPDEFRNRLLQPGEELRGNLGLWMPDRAAQDPHCWVELTAWSTGGRGVDVHRFPCE